MQSLANYLATLRTALEQARDELKRANDAHACIRPDVRFTVNEALAKVPFVAPIEHASDVEKMIVGKLVMDVLNAGYLITVNDGVENVLVRSDDPAAIFKALASTDADTLHLTSHPNKRRTFVDLVWGNDVDVISDYGVSLEDVIRPSLDLCEQLEG